MIDELDVSPRPPAPRRISTLRTVLLGITLGVAATSAYFHLRPGLSPEQITTALGMHYWKYTIPPNDGSQFLEFQVTDGDSITHESGGSAEWTPGETVIVTIRPVMHAKKLECSILARGRQFHTVINDPFRGIVSYTPNSESVSDRPLVQGARSPGGTVTPSHPEKNLAIRLVMVASDMPPSTK